MTSTQKILVNLEEWSEVENCHQGRPKEGTLDNVWKGRINTFLQSDVLAYDENSFCAKNMKKASRCHGALGRRFGRTRPLPQANPPDKRKTVPHQGHHRWEKEGNCLIHAHWLINPHQNCLLWSVTWSYKHLGGTLGAMGHGIPAPLAELQQCHCSEKAIVLEISPQLKHLPQTERCLFFLHAQSDTDPTVPWKVDPATKGLHAAT